MALFRYIMVRSGADVDERTSKEIEDVPFSSLELMMSIYRNKIS